MSDTSKTFTYETDGLSYMVTVYQDPETGEFLADITVLEGAMDVNAVYFGDDDPTGPSKNLGGPLNMNGSSLNGEKIQWDEAVQLSNPGLGPDGEDKETYLTEGETLTIELDIESLDELDFFGVRATSTTTDEGSIKGVSEEHDEPDEPTFDKVGFGFDVDENGIISNGVYIRAENLPEGDEATFENYVAYFETQFDITDIETVIFYELVEETDADGNPLEIPQELFRIDAPEGGFQNADELLAAYDEAIEEGALDEAVSGEDAGLELMAALSLADDGEVDARVPEELHQDATLDDELDLA